MRRWSLEGKEGGVSRWVCRGIAGHGGCWVGKGRARSACG